MECVYKTSTNVPEVIGGRCVDGKIKGGIEIPGLDSFLVGFSTDTKVTGLETVPPEDRPKNLTLLHLAFDIMVGIGTALMFLAMWLAWAWWRKRDIPKTPWFLRAVAVSGVSAIIAMEAGWIVTEVGRQPWIVYEQMRVEDAVTGASGVWYSFTAVVILYTLVGAGLIYTLRSMSKRWREDDSDDDTGMPYGPQESP